MNFPLPFKLRTIFASSSGSSQDNENQWMLGLRMRPFAKKKVAKEVLALAGTIIVESGNLVEHPLAAAS
jgi:hypothetical protein